MVNFIIYVCLQNHSKYSITAFVKNLALIVAAGKGKRFGGQVPKQYELLNAKPILLHSVEVFLAHPQIDAVRVVICKEHEELYKMLGLNVDYVFGGEERQDSVRLGLQGLECDNVLIHDAARPFVTAKIIDNVLAGLKEHEAVIPVISSTDSARYEGRAIDRDNLKFVQTPQAFKYTKILAAHGAAKAIYTDDAQIAEAAGMEIFMVEGDVSNKKVTIQGDLNMADIRVGMGYDVHAFETGTHITLCGVKIPHTHALKGHSDADVAMHAITDAILGAIGAGDIGEHFPPTEAKWKNADSSVFLQHAAGLVADMAAKINNIDLTIICEKPKILPHKDAMRANIAKILQIAENQVNIKATTTEGLGFAGREEGIAAQAIATIAILS